VFYYQTTLAYTCRDLARVSAQLGRADEAFRWLDKAVAIDERYSDTHPTSRFNLACDLALGVPLLSGPPGTAEARRRARADQAMDALRRAIAQGYRTALIARDPDLAALRDRADFQKLLADVEAKMKKN